jgi:hypothetical protein
MSTIKEKQVRFAIYKMLSPNYKPLKKVKSPDVLDAMKLLQLSKDDIVSIESTVPSPSRFGPVRPPTPPKKRKRISEVTALKKAAAGVFFEEEVRKRRSIRKFTK